MRVCLAAKGRARCRKLPMGMPQQITHGHTAANYPWARRSKLPMGTLTGSFQARPTSCINVEGLAAKGRARRSKLPMGTMTGSSQARPTSCISVELEKCLSRLSFLYQCCISAVSVLSFLYLPLLPASSQLSFLYLHLLPASSSASCIIISFLYLHLLPASSPASCIITVELPVSSSASCIITVELPVSMLSLKSACHGARILRPFILKRAYPPWA